MAISRSPVQRVCQDEGLCAFGGLISPCCCNSLLLGMCIGNNLFYGLDADLLSYIHTNTADTCIFTDRFVIPGIGLFCDSDMHMVSYVLFVMVGLSQKVLSFCV